MPSLVEQLQRDACSETVRVSSVLRKMKVAAFKLGLDSVEEWVNHELNGYGELDVPSYRMIPGHLRAWNPYRGWIPVTGPFVAQLSKLQISQSINSIEDLLSGGPDDNLAIEVNAKLADALDEGSDMRFGRYQWQLGRSNIVNIVDNVRNLALDWAINLERQGITGEGISFSDEEKDLAKNSGSSITFGPGATVIGNLGQGNTSGNITAHGMDAAAVLSLLDQISTHRSALANEGVDDARVGQLLDRLRQECSKQSPNASFIKAALVDLRNTVSGAAGNLIASGIVATITALLGNSAN